MEVFVFGIVLIDGRFEGIVLFFFELIEMYFVVDNEDEEIFIYFLKFEGDKWMFIECVDFINGRKNEEMYLFVSFDGKRIYFIVMDFVFIDEKIWYVDCLEDVWSDVILFDLFINDDLVFFFN